jgi:hypothetical protein
MELVIGKERMNDIGSVEAMVGVVGRVGQAAPHLVPGFHDDDLEGLVGRAAQVNRKGRARIAPTHDHDALHRFAGEMIEADKPCPGSRNGPEPLRQEPMSI